MAPTRGETYRALQELYDQVPAIPDCQGHCWISCGPVEMSDAERTRIRRAGYRISDATEVMRTWDKTFWCEALTGDGRCAVYDQRPMLCRIWGAVESMPCPYGCRPERWLSDEEAYRLIVMSIAIGGGAGAICYSPGDVDEIVAGRRPLRAFIKAQEGGRRGIALRMADYSRHLPPEVARRRKSRKPPGPR